LWAEPGEERIREARGRGAAERRVRERGMGGRKEGQVLNLAHSQRHCLESTHSLQQCNNSITRV
jgi:hypothetical protein